MNLGKSPGNQVKIFCDICSSHFDSQDDTCKKCEDYKEALEMFGRTKSNEEYQLDMLIAEAQSLRDTLVELSSQL